MQSTLYLLLAILFVFVINSTSVDQKQRKSDSALDQKKKVVVSNKDNGHNKDIDRTKDYGYGKKKNENVDDDDDEVDDMESLLSSYAQNRYSAFNPSESNYRTRSRWPSSSSSSSSLSTAASPPFFYGDLMNGNDWSRFELENAFPSSLPSISFDNNPLLSNGPSCNSLVDPQYPIFSDTCGAVPQARYSLPNAFGHRERWQIAQVLNSLIGSSTDPACTRSLRLLLCPILFPPCSTRHEPPPILPCQSYCRAVKSRCAIPTLDILPCEVLPYSSDLCPNNQQYGSFIPSGPFSSVAQSLSMTGGLPSSNYPTSRSFPSLQSILSSSNLQLPTSASPSNLYNGGPYATDSLTPILVDFPPRSYANDYRQASRYAPFTRSSTETRTASDARFSTAPRPSAVSSVVQA